MIQNLQDEIDIETPIKRGKAAEEMNWTEYHNTSVIYEWIEGLQKDFPGIVSVINIGQSYEGTPIKLVKISKKAVNEKFNYRINHDVNILITKCLIYCRAIELFL